MPLTNIPWELIEGSVGVHKTYIRVVSNEIGTAVYAEVKRKTSADPWEQLVFDAESVLDCAKELVDVANFERKRRQADA